MGPTRERLAVKLWIYSTSPSRTHILTVRLATKFQVLHDHGCPPLNAQTPGTPMINHQPHKCQMLKHQTPNAQLLKCPTLKWSTSRLTHRIHKLSTARTQICKFDFLPVCQCPFCFGSTVNVGGVGSNFGLQRGFGILLLVRVLVRRLSCRWTAAV